MDESVTFWLENRKCAGIKSAEIGAQQLILYRDRYYVVAEGAAQTRAGRPLRFSTSSLPSSWKLALKGEAPLQVASLPDTETESVSIKQRNDRKKTEKPVMTTPQLETVHGETAEAPLPGAKPKRKSEVKPTAHPPVAANCPYCHARHEIPLEKGKSGKPFFMLCNRCKKDFAVRFVQVTMFQAQVAGFQQI